MSEENSNITTESTPVAESAKKTFSIRPAGSGSSQASQPRSFGQRSQGSSNFGRPAGGAGRRTPGMEKRGGRDGRRQKDDENSNLDTQVILVRRVTRVVKGGKRMRFSALVVSGDKAGKVGYGLKKGLDFQDAVAKATKQAQDNLIKITLNNEGSISFPIKQKFKACELMLKPAKTGTGLIAGGFLRPVLELAGVQNIYSKIITSRNKVAGVQASFEALKHYEAVKK